MKRLESKQHSKMDNPEIPREKLVELAISIADDCGIKFDFSENSVKKIDLILDAIHRDIKDSPPDQEKQEGIYGIALEMSAYMIEVIEKHYAKGEWRRDSEDIGPETWPFTAGDVTIFPVNWCLKAVEQGKEERIWPKYVHFVKSLKKQNAATAKPPAQFKQNYTLEINPELPGDGEWHRPKFYFPQGLKPKPTDDLLTIRVDASNTSWIGHLKGRKPYTNVYATPNPNTLLLLVNDKASYVNTRDPQDVQSFGMTIKDITPLPEKGLILLNDYNFVIALDADGIKWETDALVQEDLCIVGIENETIVCRGCVNEATNEFDTIYVDIHTGKVLPERPAPKRSNLLFWKRRK